MSETVGPMELPEPIHLVCTDTSTNPVCTCVQYPGAFDTEGNPAQHERGCAYHYPSPSQLWEAYKREPFLVAFARQHDADRAALEQAVADEHAESLALRDNCTALATDKMRLRQRVVQIVRVCESDPTKLPVRQFAAQVLALCVAALGDEPDALEQRVRELEARQHFPRFCVTYKRTDARPFIYDGTKQELIAGPFPDSDAAAAYIEDLWQTATALRQQEPQQETTA